MLALISTLSSVFQSCLTFTFPAPSHVFHFIYGCYETDDVRVDLVVDEDTIGYADFNKQEMVWRLPYVPSGGKDLKKEAFKFARNSIAHCHSVLAKAKKADHGSPLHQGNKHLVTLFFSFSKKSFVFL